MLLASDRRNDKLNIRSCGSKIRTLSKSFIDFHKAREVEQLKDTQRKRRREIWNLKYGDIRTLYTDIFCSYKVHLHYLSFGEDEIDGIFGPSNRRGSRRYRSKIFINKGAINWGRHEAECYQILDEDNNIIRRPLWIKIENNRDLDYLFNKIFFVPALGVENHVHIEKDYRDNRINRVSRLRSGPIMQPDINIVIDLTERHDPLLLPIPNRYEYHCPTYRVLDKSKYINKVHSIEGVNSPNKQKITKYIEHSLLSVNPKLRYVKRSYIEDCVSVVQLYDEDEELIETERIWSVDSDNNKIALDCELTDSRLIQELTIESGDIISTLRTLFFQGTEKIISLFISKKDDYSITIDGEDNQAKVCVATEPNVPEIAGIRAYKSALTQNGEKCLVELIIPANARVASSIHAAGKCRSDKAIPSRIWIVTKITKVASDSETDSETSDESDFQHKIAVGLTRTNIQKAYSFVYDKGKDFEYELNKEIILNDHDFDRALDDICRPGIHYCLNKKEALDFHYPGVEISEVTQTD